MNGVGIFSCYTGGDDYHIVLFTLFKNLPLYIHFEGGKINITSTSLYTVKYGVFSHQPEEDVKKLVKLVSRAYSLGQSGGYERLRENFASQANLPAKLDCYKGAQSLLRQSGIKWPLFDLNLIPSEVDFNKIMDGYSLDESWDWKRSFKAPNVWLVRPEYAIFCENALGYLGKALGERIDPHDPTIENIILDKIRQKRQQKACTPT